MGSYAGVMKIAAARVGMTLAEYMARLDAGEKWCTGCKAWHPRAVFVVDRSRGDGLRARCLAADRGRTQPNRKRDPLRERARSLINARVARGVIPPANRLPCVDCGHVWGPGERRHEYDHYLGYEPEHHGDVESTCTLCHADREKIRNG